HARRGRPARRWSRRRRRTGTAVVPRGALRAGGARAGGDGRPGAEANGGAPSAAGSGDAAHAVLATYRDLGSFQLLLALQDDDALRLFCDSILAPIEQSEGAYGGELM